MQFVTVRYVDGHPSAKAVIERFRVQGFPTLLVLGPDGEEWDEVWGSTPEEFVEDLARLRAGTRTLLALRTQLEQDPEDRETARKLAAKLCNRFPDEAIDLCRRLLDAVPDGDDEATAELLFIQGYSESNREGHEAALTLYERVLTEFPKTDAARDAAIFATNDLPLLPPERGLAFLRKAIPFVDEDMRRTLEYTRGYLYLKAAEDEWRLRGEEAKDEAESLNAVAWECFLRNWHTEQAILWARKAVERSDRAPHILDTLANLLFRSGAVDEAIRLEQEALAGATDAATQTAFEENLVQWKAVQALRAKRKAKDKE